MNTQEMKNQGWMPRLSTSSGPLLQLGRGGVFAAPDDGVAPVAEPAAPVPAADPPSAASAEPPASSSVFGDQSLDDIFSFDPFAGQDTTPAPVDPTPVGQTPPTGADSITAAVQPETTTAPAGQDDLTTSLRDLVNTLQTQQQGSSTEAAPAEPASPFEGVQIPDRLVQAINSDDPRERAAGINAIARGTMETVYKQITKELQDFVSQGLPQMVMGMLQHQQQTRTIEEDFYGTYKELNKPQLRPLITALAQQKIAAAGKNFQGWNAQFRDELARDFLASIKDLIGPPAAQPVPPAPAAQQFQVPGGAARPAAEPVNEIMDLLF